MTRYLVTGFCDVYVKPAGDGGIVRFREADRFIADVLPTRGELIEYAEKRGYPIGESRSSGMGIIHGERYGRHADLRARRRRSCANRRYGRREDSFA